MYDMTAAQQQQHARHEILMRLHQQTLAFQAALVFTASPAVLQQAHADLQQTIAAALAIFAAEPVHA